jgi:hypothetical protein
MTSYTQYDIMIFNFVSDLRQVGGFSIYTVSSTNKTDLHDITEIMLKVALNTITINCPNICFVSTATRKYKTFNEYVSP